MMEGRGEGVGATFVLGTSGIQDGVEEKDIGEGTRRTELTVHLSPHSDSEGQGRLRPSPRSSHRRQEGCYQCVLTPSIYVGGVELMWCGSLSTNRY